MSSTSSVAALPKSQIAPSDAQEFGEIVQMQSGKLDYAVSNPLQRISGFTNYTPQEMTVITEWKRLVSDTYRRYGFTSIEPRPVEYAANLLKKGGVSKQIFGVSRLQDGSLTNLGLPFDRTLPLAIFVVANHEKLTLPYKRYDVGLSWRGEHARAGRYRAFIQADIDIVDKNITYRADAEAVATIVKALHAIGIKDCKVFVNHILIGKAIIEAAGVPKDKLESALRAIDKLKADNRAEVVKELVESISELNQEAAEKLLDNMNYEGSIRDFQFQGAFGKDVLEAHAHLIKVEDMCAAMGIEKGTLQFRLNLTRGLDYYTGIVFETFIPGKEQYGSIASGGRYDKLVDGFAGKDLDVQGVGGSIGLTRLFDVQKEENAIDLSKQTTAKVFVGYRTLEEGCFEKALEVAAHLRELGHDCELYTADKIKVTKQLDICNKKGIPFAVMVMNKDEIQLKSMAQSKTTNCSSVEELVHAVNAANDLL